MGPELINIIILQCLELLLLEKADPKHIKMHEACIEALTNCVKTLVPGKTAGDVFDAHAKTFDDLGFNKARMNACGYSLGSTFSPNWMDWPMLYTGNPYKIVPGNVFFMHMILMDSDNNLAMNLGETYLVTENGNERLGNKSWSGGPLVSRYKFVTFYPIKSYNSGTIVPKNFSYFITIYHL